MDTAQSSTHGNVARASNLRFRAGRGQLDLLSCNGHLEQEIGKVQQSQTYAQPAQLFWNSGALSGPTFIPVAPDSSRQGLFQPIVGRGAAAADIDGDGDLDLVLTQVGGAPLLLRNDQSAGHHWLRLKLAGSRGNRDALGARVLVRSGSLELPREVNPTRGYLSQSELALTFGLGAGSRVDSVQIVWPGGARQDLRQIPVDKTTFVVEPSSSDQTRSEAPAPLHD